MQDTTQILDLNAELHARPSMYFAAPAFVEHIALLVPEKMHGHSASSPGKQFDEQGLVRTEIEHHTEFATVTRVTQLSADPTEWPALGLSLPEAAELTGVSEGKFVCRVCILVCGSPPFDMKQLLRGFDFAENIAVSSIGEGAAQLCSDFQLHSDCASRIVFFNKELDIYRLGRRVRRILEIETYRSMALLGLPEARRIAGKLAQFDRKLVDLTNRNMSIDTIGHKALLEEISSLSGEIVSVTAATRHRFGATSAYASIVDERVNDLREKPVTGFQRYGTFILRRFRPAIRTCAATSLRLEQLSHATMHLIDLLQTRIQVEIEYQNAAQIRLTAERAATQVKIQHAVEGFSIIAISYYLVGLLKSVSEVLDHAGLHVNAKIMLIVIPIVVIALVTVVARVKRALRSGE